MAKRLFSEKVKFEATNSETFFSLSLLSANRCQYQTHIPLSSPLRFGFRFFWGEEEGTR